jgi:hypothetical protein
MPDGNIVVSQTDLLGMGRKKGEKASSEQIIPSEMPMCWQFENMA